MLDDPFNGGAEETKEKSDPFDDNFSSITPTQKNFNPFDELGGESYPTEEKIDVFSLPLPDDIKKNTSNNNDLFSVEPIQQSINTQRYSEELYAIPNRSKPRKEINENEVPLMKHDPFDELKKNINELHKQNVMHQHQQQMIFTPAFPNHTHHQVPVHTNQANPYIPSIPRPFMGNVYANNSLPPPIPARPTPGIPAWPSPAVQGTNPFLSQQQSNQTNVEPNMGWAVMQPNNTLQKEVVKPNVLASDPFSFLNDQADLKTNSQPTVPTTNQFAGNNELLDLLG